MTPITRMATELRDPLRGVSPFGLIGIGELKDYLRDRGLNVN
jgi:hypothetical protein